jgi:hypothetical protein
LKNQPAVGGALVVKRKIRDGREGRLESGKALQRLWAQIFFFIERQSAVPVKNRHQALAKMTAGNRGRGPAGHLWDLKQQHKDNQCLSLSLRDLDNSRDNGPKALSVETRANPLTSFGLKSPHRTHSLKAR